MSEEGKAPQTVARFMKSPASAEPTAAPVANPGPAAAPAVATVATSFPDWDLLPPQRLQIVPRARRS